MTRQEWIKVALKNGIAEGSFNNRVYGFGYSFEEAATMPLKKGYYTEIMKKAHATGNMLTYTAVRYRLKYKKMLSQVKRNECGYGS